MQEWQKPLKYFKIKYSNQGWASILRNIQCAVVLEIFEKYQENSNSLPKAYSKQKFNDCIKEVCDKAAFIETGRLSTDAIKSLFECDTSHTASRRCSRGSNSV
jgi:hypothetical protein